MELQIAGSKKSMSVSDTVFDRKYSEALVHQVVVAYRNAGRSGTKAQKTRAEVNGTTKKSKAQKGGGARHGAVTAPIFVGGGRAFAARRQLTGTSALFLRRFARQARNEQATIRPGARPSGTVDLPWRAS